MDLQIDINGRVRTVGLEPKPDGRLAVTVDGETRMIDVAAVDDATFSFILPDDGHRSEEIGLSATAMPGEIAVHLDSGVATARIVSGAGRFGRGGAVQAVGTPQGLAPRPGKVVTVLVKAGDEVKARQGLIVVEAMKMENELRSPKDGRVIEVAASEGMSVEAGRLLVVVE